MRNVLVLSFVLAGAMVAPLVPADPPDAEVREVLDQYRSALPALDDLAVYRLDWTPTLDEAKQKGAREHRPVLLIVVTNSYGNLHSGHC
jgi:hypothetical protein